MSTKVLTDLDLDNNDLLNVGSGGGGASPLTTKGDLYTYDTADQRLPVGTDGQILSANSATATGLEWIANTGGGGGGGTNEGASVSRSTDTAITPSVLFPIVWENEDDDDNGYVDLGANNTRITIPEDGTYLVRVQLAFENTVSTNEIRSVRLRLNGSTVISRADQAALANGTNATIVQVTWMGDLVATDYLEATAFIVESGIDLIASSSSFSIEKIPAGGGGTGGSGGSGTNTYVELTRTTNQTIATGAPGTVVEWENEVHDTDNLVDLGSSNTDIVVSEAGEYILYFEFVWNANATSFRQVAVLVNGTPVSSVRDIPPTSGNAVTAGTSIVLDLSASDVISIRVRQDTGSNLDLTGTQLVRLVQFKAGGGGTGGSGGSGTPLVRGRAQRDVSLQSLTSGDSLIWETAVIDEDSMFDIGGANPERLTINTTGRYLVEHNVRITTSTHAGTFTSNRIFLNGTTPLTNHVHEKSSAGASAIGNAFVYDFTAGDYITFEVFHDDGGTIDTVVSDATYIAVTQLPTTEGGSGGSSGGGYAEDIGDGVTTNIVVNHNLGSRDVSVTVYEAGSPYKEVGVDTEHTDDNNVTLLFTVAPTTNQYRVFVTSGGGAGGSSGRELLTANRTYYVATTGSDSNDGLTVGNPFLTIQKAIDVAAALDSSIYDVTIDVADGTYALSAALVARTMVGSGSITIEGNVATPGNVIIQDDTVFSDELFGMRDVYTTYTLKGIRFNDTGVGISRLIWTQTAILFMEDMEFYGNGTGYAVRGQTNSRVTGNSTDWAFSGSFAVALSAENGATVGMNNSSVTMVSTPNWTGNGFAVAQRGAAALFFFAVTVNGTATGKRFTSDNHGAVQTFGQPTTFLPGDVAGTADAATFALYG